MEEIQKTIIDLCQGTLGRTPNNVVPMVFMVFSRDAWGLFHPQTPTKKGFFLSGFFPGLSQDIVVPASLKGFVHTKPGIPR